MSIAVPDRAQALVIARYHPGTQVLFRWAEWQKQHAYPRPIQIAAFRKEDSRLVVHCYGPALCVAIKEGDTAPKIREFREWRQPLAVVKGKLIRCGWVPEIAGEGVSHAR